MSLAISYLLSPFRLSLFDVTLAINSFLRAFSFFFAYTTLICERVRRRNDSRYEQFRISPETIQQEMRPVVCEQRQTNIFKENYNTDETLWGILWVLQGSNFQTYGKCGKRVGPIEARFSTHLRILQGTRIG